MGVPPFKVESNKGEMLYFAGLIIGGKTLFTMTDIIKNSNKTCCRPDLFYPTFM